MSLDMTTHLLVYGCEDHVNRAASAIGRPECQVRHSPELLEVTVRECIGSWLLQTLTGACEGMTIQATHEAAGRSGELNVFCGERMRFIREWVYNPDGSCEVYSDKPDAHQVLPPWEVQ